MAADMLLLKSASPWQGMDALQKDAQEMTEKNKKPVDKAAAL